MNTYLEALKRNRLKITPKRKAVIGIFLRHGICMRPYDIYKKLKEKFSIRGLPTVYRILVELKDAGILVQSLPEDRQLRDVLCTLPTIILPVVNAGKLKR